MKRISFLKVVGSVPFLFSSLWAKRNPQADEQNIVPTEPLESLDKIMSQFAEELGVKIESCTGEGHSHSSYFKVFKLPEQFDGKDCWLCLRSQTIHSSSSSEEFDQEHNTWATLCVENYNPISSDTQYSLAKFIRSGGNGCGEGGFGIDIRVRTRTLKGTGEVKWLATCIERPIRLYHRDKLHPLHKRVFALFEKMTSGYSYT